MIELIAIFLHLIIFLIICSFPLNPKNLNKLIKSKGNVLNYVDCHAVNIFIFINILLIASFLKIHLNYLFSVLMTISIILLIIRRDEYILLINKRNFIKFIFFLIITISIFISIAYSTKLQWDGLHWITKALVFYNNEPIQNIKFSSMPTYPHLGGYIWAFFWKNSFLQLEYFGRLFYAYFYVISIFTIFNIFNNKPRIFIFCLIFALILITFDPYLFAGYQEYLMFSTFLIASRFIITMNFSKNIEYKKIFLILFIFSPLMWFKAEGVFYFLIFSSLLVYFQKGSIKIKVLTLFLILLTISSQIYLQNKVIGSYGFAIEPFSQGFLDQILDFKFVVFKILEITKHIIIAFIKYPLWIIIFFTFLFIRETHYNKRSHFTYFLYAFILNILFVYSVYLHDTNPDPIVLAVTIDRVMFQTSGLYFVLTILILNKIKINSFKKL